MPETEVLLLEQGQQTAARCDPPRENREEGDDMGTLL